MLPKLNDLLERRAAITAELAGDKITDDRVTELRNEYDALKPKISRAEVIAEEERRAPGTPIHGDEKLSAELHKRFSLVRAMAMQAGIGGHDCGFEREVQADLARRNGQPAEGVLVPMEVFLERRAALTTTGPSGAPGGILVQTELHSEMFFDRLRNAQKVASMGATVLSNLMGNIDIPGLKDSVTVGWAAEDSPLSGSVPGFRKVSMTPHHAGGITELSRNMLMQASPDVESLVRNDFAQMLGEVVDKAAIYGTGTSNQPLGILNTSGIGSLAMGTNGSAWTADAARDLIGKPDIANAPMMSRGFLTNMKVKTASLKLKDGQGRYFGLDTVFGGERVEFSNSVPSNGTKGTGTALSTVIYGNWADLIIGYWSAFDLLVNPYESTAYAKGNVSVRAMLTCDVAVRYVDSFAAATDVIAP